MSFNHNNPHSFLPWDDTKHTDWWSEDNIVRFATTQNENSSPSSDDCWKEVGKNVAQMDIRYEATFREWLRKEDNLSAITSFLQRIANEYPLDRIINALKWLISTWKVESTAHIIRQITLLWAAPPPQPALSPASCSFPNHNCHPVAPSPGLTQPLANAAGPTLTSMASNGNNGTNNNSSLSPSKFLGGGCNVHSKRDHFLPSPFNSVPAIITPSMVEGEVRRAVLVRELTRDWGCSQIAQLIILLSQSFWNQRQLLETFIRNMVLDWSFCRLSEFFSHLGNNLGLDYKVKVDMLQQTARSGINSRSKNDKRKNPSQDAPGGRKRQRVGDKTSMATVSVTSSVSSIPRTNDDTTQNTVEDATSQKDTVLADKPTANPVTDNSETGRVESTVSGRSTDDSQNVCNFSSMITTNAATATTATAPASPASSSSQSSSATPLLSHGDTANRYDAITEGIVLQNPGTSSSSQQGSQGGAATASSTSNTRWSSEERNGQRLYSATRSRVRHLQRPSIISSTFSLSNASTNISSTSTNNNNGNGNSSNNNNNNASVPSSSPATSTCFDISNGANSNGGSNGRASNTTSQIEHHPPHRSIRHQATSSTVNSPTTATIARPRTTSETECVQFEQIPSNSRATDVIPSSLSLLIRATDPSVVPVSPPTEISFSVLPPRSVPMSSVCNNSQVTGDVSTSQSHMQPQITTAPSNLNTINETTYDVLGIRISQDSSEYLHSEASH
ncbi:hypothetical protein H4219_002316 [Mycoemilia scoparia]|uniref:Uncharacterized protein n=1 Tax=Mycoemilia scoparia TaxID=417184 RepID=A0A9W8A2R3_9FUNG|nr:hypothetical protein H4219_002316 [Mycoemilia scoparia]